MMGSADSLVSSGMGLTGSFLGPLRRVRCFLVRLVRPFSYFAVTTRDSTCVLICVLRLPLSEKDLEQPG